MSTSKILMTGFLWLFLGLMSGCNKSEVMFETGEGARSVGKMCIRDRNYSAFNNHMQIIDEHGEIA